MGRALDPIKNEGRGAPNEFLRSTNEIVKSRNAAIRRLKPEEDRLRRIILDNFRRMGRAPSRVEMVAALGMSPSRVDAILRRLDEVDVVYLDPDSNEIAAAYPFSDLPTPHLVAFLD